MFLFIFLFVVSSAIITSLKCSVIFASVYIYIFIVDVNWNANELPAVLVCCFLVVTLATVSGWDLWRVYHNAQYARGVNGMKGLSGF